MMQTFKKLCVGLCCILAVALPFVFGGCSDEDDFVPELPEPLSEELEAQFKQDYFDRFIRDHPYWSCIIIDNSFVVEFYWGTYNDCIVITIHNLYINGWDDWGMGPLTYIDEDTGFEFPGDIYVWENGNFHDLFEAWDQGLLANNDMRNIMHLRENGLHGSI